MEEDAKMRRRLAAKYGLMARLRGGGDGHIVLEISPA